jgi:hypothetical protein
MNYKVIIVDKISFSSFIRLIKYRKNTIINLGDNLNKFTNFILIVIFKFKIKTPSFFLGDVKLEDNESLALKVRKNTNNLATDFSQELIKNHNFLNIVNSEFGNNTFIVGYARIVASELEPVLNIIHLSHFLFPKDILVFLLKKPKSFPEDFIISRYDHDFLFYGVFLSEVFVNVKKRIKKIIKSIIKAIIFSYKSIISVPTLNFDGTILTGLEDTIRIETDLRNQIFWYSSEFKYELICFNNSFLGTTKFRTSKNLPANCRVINFFDYIYFSKIYSRDSVFSNIRETIKKIDDLIRKSENSVDYNILVFARNLFYESIEMGSLIKSTKCKAIISKEVQNTYFDAVQLCPISIKPKTIGIQYSNMPMFSPFMISTCDYFLIFSKFYEQFFKYQHYGPIKLIESGYIYKSILSQTKKRAEKFIKDNSHLNDKIILGYFDESIQNSKWGFISEEHYLSDVVLLAEFVISNPKIVVIFKTQFMSNLPSIKFSNNTILNEAIKTGRFIDYFEGLHRNEIYPSEVAHLSKICISNKIGATAGLESYLAGCNTVLIDSMGLNCKQDVFYLSQPNLHFPSLKSFLFAFKESNLNYEIFGDWSNFVQYLDSKGNIENELLRIIYKNNL